MLDLNDDRNNANGGANAKPQQPVPDPREMRARREARSRARTQKFLLAGMGVILLAIGALAWTIYPQLKTHDDSLAAIPKLEESVQVANTNIQENADRMRGLEDTQQQLRDQVQQTAAGLRERIAAAGKEAGASAATLLSNARAELEQRIEGIGTRLSELETSDADAATRLAALESELDQVNAKVADQDRLLASMQDRAQASATETAALRQQLTSTQAAQARNRGDFDSFSQRIETRTAVRRVDFEVKKDEDLELAPGTRIGIHKTNVSYQRVDGWAIGPDGRTIWLRQQPTQEPVVLFSTRDGRKYEMVLTRVSDNSAVGYLLMPADVQPATLPVDLAGE